MSVDLHRVLRVVDWLIFAQVVTNRRDLASKLGYTESSLSQILNGRVALSDRFLKKLIGIDERINSEWIFNGTGEMLDQTKRHPVRRYVRYNSSRDASLANDVVADYAVESSAANPDIVTIPREAWDVICNQAASLKEKDDQVNRMITLLEKKGM